MGSPLAMHLGLAVGDPVTLVLSSPTNDSIVPRLERFTLVGTFEIGAELDYGLVLIGLDDVRARGLGSTGKVGVRVRLADPIHVDVAVAELAKLTPPGWQITDWRSNYGELFRAVRLEKSMMFMLLVLIVAIAAFNIVSAQTMLVNDKRTDIAILRTMGASEGLVLRLVLVQGILVALGGIGFGLLLGLLLANHVTETVSLLESLIGARLLDGSYFDTVPSVVLASRHRADRGGVICVLRGIGAASGPSRGGVESRRSAARGVLVPNVPAMVRSRLPEHAFRARARAIVSLRRIRQPTRTIARAVTPLTHPQTSEPSTSGHQMRSNSWRIHAKSMCTSVTIGGVSISQAPSLYAKKYNGPIVNGLLTHTRPTASGRLHRATTANAAAISMCIGIGRNATNSPMNAAPATERR